MKGLKVLIIDDDPAFCNMVESLFIAEDAETFKALDGRVGLQQFFAHRPDVVILDIKMPGMDGWETCHQIRLLSDVPIILLTSLREDDQIARGLDHGADDFVSKPFNPEVLLARTRAVMRRHRNFSADKKKARYTDGYLTVDLDQQRVYVQGNSITLTATEYQLLTFLVTNAGRVLTYQQILTSVWGWEYNDSIDYVHVYLSHLRRKLEENPRKPKYLVNIHGIGYRFEKH